MPCPPECSQLHWTFGWSSSIAPPTMASGKSSSRSPSIMRMTCFPWDMVTTEVDNHVQPSISKPRGSSIALRTSPSASATTFMRQGLGATPDRRVMSNTAFPSGLMSTAGAYAKGVKSKGQSTFICRQPPGGRFERGSQGSHWMGGGSASFDAGTHKGQLGAKSSQVSQPGQPGQGCGCGGPLSPPEPPVPEVVDELLDVLVVVEAPVPASGPASGSAVSLVSGPRRAAVGETEREGQAHGCSDLVLSS